jgi:hypothetical protein
MNHFWPTGRCHDETRVICTARKLSLIINWVRLVSDLLAEFFEAASENTAADIFEMS